MTAIILCGCKSPYQDAVYGVGRRVFNQTTQSDKKMFRCTICSNIKGVNLTAEEAKKLSKKGK